jgi:hypothetical protein
MAILRPIATNAGLEVASMLDAQTFRPEISKSFSITLVQEGRFIVM